MLASKYPNSVKFTFILNFPDFPRFLEILRFVPMSTLVDLTYVLNRILKPTKYLIQMNASL
jgi:hypothetical protein